MKIFLCVILMLCLCVSALGQNYTAMTNGELERLFYFLGLTGSVTVSTSSAYAGLSNSELQRSFYLGVLDGTVSLGGSSLGTSVLTAGPGTAYPTVQAAVNQAFALRGWIATTAWDGSNYNLKIIVNSAPSPGQTLILPYESNTYTFNSAASGAGALQIYIGSSPTTASVATAITLAINTADGPGQAAVSGSTILYAAGTDDALADMYNSASTANAHLSASMVQNTVTTYSSGTTAPVTITMPAGTYTGDIDVHAGTVILSAWGPVSITGAVTVDTNSNNPELYLQGDFTISGAVTGNVTSTRQANTNVTTVYNVTELQAAVTAGQLNIVCGAGTYTLSDTLTLPANTTLSSYGRSAILTGGGDTTGVLSLGNNCSLCSLTITNNRSTGVNVAGNGCRVSGCEITCTEWCIQTSTAVDNLVVDSNILKGINPIFPVGAITRSYITNNVGYFANGADQCHALLDLSSAGSTSNHLVVANNVMYWERASSVTTGEGGLLIGNALYFVKLEGWGHTISNNTIRYTSDCKNAAMPGPMIVQFYNTGGAPTIGTIDRETLISGNVLDMYFRNMAGDFSSAPKACNITGGPDGPVTFKNNVCHLSGTTYASSNATPQTLTAMVPGFNTQLTASMPTITIYPDGLFGANVAGADWSATGHVANLVIPQVWPGQPTPSITTANIDRAHLLAAFGDAKLLGSGWRSLVFDSTLSTYKIVTSDGSQFHVQSTGAAFGSGL